MLIDTIAQIATASGNGAISIIKVSGKEAIEIVNKVFSKDLSKKESHTITYGHIIDKGEIVDEVLISIFHSPKTFTGEDVVEINCHGGIYVTRKILGIILSMGARLALNGEFSKRAFLNGRIDLTQAEAINDLINAKDEVNVKIAMNALKGSVAKNIYPLIEELLNIIAHIEVNIDYPEYDDVEQLHNNTLKPLIIDLHKKVEKLLKEASNTRVIKKGIKTAIIGKPNVGKSSLLNSLLEENKAIVTDVAGTTRDLVEGIVQIDNISLHLIDTAGIRETVDVVEKIGIERSVNAINEAELCIMVLSNSSDIDEEDDKLLGLIKNKQHIIVYNKSDFGKKEGAINISALNNDIDELKLEIKEMYKDYTENLDASSLNNERQISCLLVAKNELEEALNSLELNMETDLIAINLQEAFGNLSDILGQRNREDLIDSLFSKFCLGK